MLKQAKEPDPDDARSFRSTLERAAQAAEAPMQVQQLEPDAASECSSRASWEEGRAHDGPSSDVSSDSHEESDAEERSDHADARCDQLGAIGFALAKSAVLLPSFQTTAGSRNCLDA